MNETHNNRTSLVKGAKDIAKEAKRQAGKNFSKAVDRASDEYSAHRSYNRFHNDEEEENDYNCHYDGKAANDEDGASSDATEGHDDEDEIYEGEYQGVPAYQEGKPRDGQTPPGQPADDGPKSRKELENERQADEEELAQQYELIMQECGHGRFQWQLFFVLGLALMSDGVEVFVVGFVLPSAETDMCVPNSGAGWLGSIVYLGMMFGAFFWGGLSDKLGRKQCLLISLSANGFFAFLSSFVQGYSTFLFCRMLSGFGIGGAVPIVFSYFAEVLAREKRGEHLSWLCMFWMIGGIYASAMAWAIIPHYGWSFSMGSAYQFHSWRVFVVVCALPCVSAVVSLTFMPESPRFFLQMGKHDEAWMVLKHIHDINMRARGEPERVFTVNRIKIPKLLDELMEMQSESANPVLKVLSKVKAELRGIWSTFMRCFDYPVKDNTMKLAAVWFTLSFGYYGLSVWFPDVIKHLQADEYASRVKIHTNERIEDFTFNFTLENQIHRNGVFLNDRYRRRQADKLQGGQHHFPPQQDGLSDDLRRRLQCLLGLLRQLPRNAGRAARQHRLGPPHGQNRPPQHVGWLHGAVGHQLLLPVVRHQRVHDDLHAVPVQRPQHLRLELLGCGHHGAVPHRQKRHRLRLLQRPVQAGRRAGQPDLRLSGGYHQGHPHPAGVMRAGLRWVGGPAAARHAR
ncbi:synaptic vesicle glycoprotein 2C-like isoform X2 [Phyllopteryx taeniolatus]|uniref:synaptic vesicle glycoprotein 2C-like isoform X2 n=1 Tax=Phyllopteryx taeniolatus TaxID=161469 RepID=UPI002AD2FA56|nr:synaptic vesicle glycoprotein 2C-like isoform X2 [Phyllopteryx taeniolatus]